MDVKYFYLNIKMERIEYIMIQIASTGMCGQIQYLKKSHNGYIYTKVTKGIYGIPQAGRIAHDALVKHPEPYVYHPPRKPPGLWTHKN